MTEDVTTAKQGKANKTKLSKDSGKPARKQSVRADKSAYIISYINHSTKTPEDETPNVDTFELETDDEDLVLTGATECDALDRMLLHITEPPFPTAWV